jgi:hypothetical protein
MALNDEIQSAIDEGRGYQAEILGKPFDVYRKNEKIYNRFPVHIKGRLSDRRALEAAVSLRNIVLMELVCDGTHLKEADVLQGDVSEDRYVIASMRDLKPIIGYRTDLSITLRRPVQPNTVPDPDTNIRPYSGRKKVTDYVLTYNTTTNLYSFVEPDDDVTIAHVYAGKSQMNYSGSNTPMKLPLDTRITRWVFIMELLPGVDIRESDYIVLDGQDYQVYSIDKQRIGLNGQVIYADLMRP